VAEAAVAVVDVVALTEAAVEDADVAEAATEAEDVVVQHLPLVRKRVVASPSSRETRLHSTKH
jgi:hypothetical protein